MAALLIMVRDGAAWALFPAVILSLFATTTANDMPRETSDIARHAVADVRHVADGYRGHSLVREVASAASLLATVAKSVVTHRDSGGPENLASRLESAGGASSATANGGQRFRVRPEMGISAHPMRPWSSNKSH